MVPTPKKTKPVLPGGTKRQVYNGTARKTSGGMTKKDLMHVKRGTRVVVGKDGKKKKVPVYAIVSKARHTLGKTNLWSLSIKKARKKLKITGFKAIKKTGTEEETQLYRTAKVIYAGMKKKKTKK